MHQYLERHGLRDLMNEHSSHKARPWHVVAHLLAEGRTATAGLSSAVRVWVARPWKPNQPHINTTKQWVNQLLRKQALSNASDHGHLYRSHANKSSKNKTRSLSEVASKAESILGLCWLCQPQSHLVQNVPDAGK